MTNTGIARKHASTVYSSSACYRAAAVILAAGVLTMVMPTAASGQISLGTVAILAEQHSTAVRLAEADLLKAQAALSETRDVYIPSVTFGSGLPFVPSVGFLGGLPSIFNASMQSLVFSASQRHYINAAREGVLAASLTFKDAREQAVLDASTTYIEMDTVNRELAAAREQQDYAAHAVIIEEQRSEAGVDPLSDLLQARLTVAELKLRQIHLESRLSTLAKQLSQLTDLPLGSMVTDHATIPEIPQVHADESVGVPLAVEAARSMAQSKQNIAKADSLYTLLPQVSFNAQYARYTTLLNNADSYYARPLKADNFGSGFNLQVPLFDIGHRAKARQSAADALRATVEAEQAQRQNDLQITTLAGSLRELDALAEVASLKQEIAGEQLKAIQVQLQTGNGSGAEPGAPPQQTPKAEQLAKIDERQKTIDALDAAFDLSHARLNLLRALGHMEDWLHEISPPASVPPPLIAPGATQRSAQSGTTVAPK